MDIDAPVTHLSGVGPQVALRLQRLGISKIQDLLFHLPHRYQDRTRPQPISSLREGQESLIEVEVEVAEIRQGRRRSLLVSVRDETASLLLRFFHFSPAQQRHFRPGLRLRCFGEVRYGPDCLEMVHPDYQHLDPDNPPAADTQLTPIYPSTDGLHQNLLRKLTRQALRFPLADLLPEEFAAQQGFPALQDALEQLHYPPAAQPPPLGEGISRHPARLRLALEELLAHHLSLRLVRVRGRKKNAPALHNPAHLSRQLLDSLPFGLTGAQQRVCAEIQEDLRKDSPMQRLVQGDVGSGKTIVAALSALQAVESGYQVAVMAPTELLAEQHWRTFSQWLQPLGVAVTWLVGSLTKKQKQQALEEIASGQAQLSVGTHALFQDAVQFARLGLVIVDEQHRFGVHQRLALRDKGEHQEGWQPHQLIMTATPIPRTLAMTAYADLDTSVIDELPPGRTPVNTVVIPNSRREEVIERVAANCAEGKQAYWVCTLIEESEALESQAAEDTAEQLGQLLPQLRIGLVHGRMKPKDKDAVMQAFKAAEVDLLVATTVIEVGVDVPNASLMIIENAERLGLAQLHQLRGRVGRGAVASYCVLLYQAPLSQQGRERLATLRDTQDGFQIASKDLELRGPGEVLGTRQTGLVQLKIADLQEDRDLLDDVAALADHMLVHHRANIAPLLQRWIKDGLAYGDVF